MKSTREVAGVAIPNTPLARAAEKLTREASPPYLFNHCVRTYLFGSMVGRRAGIEHDSELLYVAAVLHDLALVSPYDASGHRFEVAGADAARNFVLERGLSERQAEQVWDAVALHAQIGIASAKGGEVALVHLGATVDVIGVGYHDLPVGLIEETVAEYPRLQFKRKFHDTLIAAARRNPEAYTLTWLADTAHEHGSADLPSFEHLLLGAPFAEPLTEAPNLNRYTQPNRQERAQ